IQSVYPQSLPATILVGKADQLMIARHARMAFTGFWGKRQLPEFAATIFVFQHKEIKQTQRQNRIEFHFREGLILAVGRKQDVALSVHIYDGSIEIVVKIMCNSRALPTDGRIEI